MQTSLISKNKVLIDKYVSSYLELTKQSVRNTLSLAKIVYEVKDKFEYSEIDEEDFKSFCRQIQVNDESSQFRKYLYIAKSADKIEQHLDKFLADLQMRHRVNPQPLPKNAPQKIPYPMHRVFEKLRVYQPLAEVGRRRPRSMSESQHLPQLKRGHHPH